MLKVVYLCKIHFSHQEMVVYLSLQGLLNFFSSCVAHKDESFLVIRTLRLKQRWGYRYSTKSLKEMKELLLYRALKKGKFSCPTSSVHLFVCLPLSFKRVWSSWLILCNKHRECYFTLWFSIRVYITYPGVLFATVLIMNILDQVGNYNFLPEYIYARMFQYT